MKKKNKPRNGTPSDLTRLRDERRQADESGCVPVVEACDEEIRQIEEDLNWGEPEERRAYGQYIDE